MIMNIEDIDAMIDAQFEYERKRLKAYNGDVAEPGHVYQFVTSEVLREVEQATKIRALRIGKDSFATAQIVYKGCVFHAPAGRAD